MSGTQGMQGGGMQPMNTMPTGSPQPMQAPMMQPVGGQAVPMGQQGGQMPVQMGQNPYQYGVPQTTQYVQNQAQMGRRMPNQPV